jgi:hypothetical protein
MLTRITLFKRVALLWVVCALPLAGMVACSTKDAPAPTPASRIIRITATDSQGLDPEYRVDIVADSTKYAEINTLLGSMSENETITCDLATLTNRPSYYARVTLAWDKVKQGGKISAKSTSSIKAEFLVNNQVKKTMTLKPTNGYYSTFQTCMFCDLDLRWLLADGLTVNK